MMKWTDLIPPGAYKLAKNKEIEQAHQSNKRQNSKTRTQQKT